MDFKEQKKLVVGAIKYGDKSIISKRLGITTNTLNTALALDSLEYATDGQVRIWEECLNFIKEKQQRIAKITNKMAAVSENLK